MGNAVAVFSVVFSFSAAIAIINTGDLLVRAFLIIAAAAGLAAGHAVWHGEKNAAKRVALWKLKGVA